MLAAPLTTRSGPALRPTARRLLLAVPRGRGLTGESWRRRHRVMLATLWLHVVALPVYGLLRGYPPAHCLVEVAPVVALALGAAQPHGGRTLRSILAALGLMTCSVLAVHLSGGVIEAHFHFFVMVALLSAYQDWFPFLIALGFVVLQHGLMGTLLPAAVYDRADAIAHPWRWALIHGGFVLAAAAANVYSWTAAEEDQRRLAAATERGGRTFRALFERHPLPMWVYDVETLRFLAVNRAAIAHYGYSREQFLVMTIAEIRPPEDVARLLSRTRRRVDGAAGRWTHRRRDGGMITVEVHSEGVEFEDRAAEVVAVHDITDRLALEAELRRRADRDPLTGAANRELFHERLAAALDGPRGGGPVAVLTLDLDDFKAVNDSHGHAAGDRALCEVATRLRATVRQHDTIARMGGDEFAVLLEGAAVAEAEEIGDRVATALRAPLSEGGAELWLSASVGIAVGSGAGDGGDTLLREADVAAYEAKAAGRGLVEVFRPSMMHSALHRLEVAADLRRALDRGEFFLEYQPVVRLSDGGIRGVEALVRWRHPERGVVSPADFIPAAEATGLIVPIGEWVLAEACGQVRAWETERPSDRRLALSVNLSPRQVRDPDMVAMVTRILEETGFDPAQLVLEVTEGTLVDDLVQARDRLDRVRTAGVKIALDDFGSGYSSLSYLRGLPLDTVKIDRSFVSGLGGDGEQRAFVLAIVRLVDTLGLPTVAEGMETTEELDYVRALGVDYAQGYLLSRPLGAAAMAALLAGPGFDLGKLTAAPRRAAA